MKEMITVHQCEIQVEFMLGIRENHPKEMKLNFLARDTVSSLLCAPSQQLMTHFLFCELSPYEHFTRVLRSHGASVLAVTIQR
jgi:hypothetical protein